MDKITERNVTVAALQSLLIVMINNVTVGKLTLDEIKKQGNNLDAQIELANTVIDTMTNNLKNASTELIENITRQMEDSNAPTN